MRQIIKSVIISVLTVTVFSLLSISSIALAATPSSTSRDQVCAGVGLSDGSTTCGDQGAQFGDAVTKVINLLSMIIGVVAVVMLIVAGFNFITSSGDTSKVGTAKNTIVYALIGLVVVSFAQLIVHFVLTNI